MLTSSFLGFGANPNSPLFKSPVKSEESEKKEKLKHRVHAAFSGPDNLERDKGHHKSRDETACCSEEAFSDKED